MNKAMFFTSVFVIIIMFCITGCGRDDDITFQPDNGGLTWKEAANSTFGSSAIRNVSYINNKFFAVGDDGKIAYSTDGKIWTAVITAFTDTIYGIAYGDGMYVIAGTFIFKHSTDLMTWTDIPPNVFGIPGPGNRIIYDIVYSDNQFLACGSNASTFRSIDGITWERWNNPLEWYDDLKVSIYDANTYIAAGGRSVMVFSTNNTILQKIDLNPFTSQNEISGIAYGDNRFVAAGVEGLIIYTDDITVQWTRVPGALKSFGYAQIYDITYGDGKFIVVGSKGYIGHSKDKGESWITAKESTFDNTAIIRSVAYGNGVFVAVGANGQIAYYSTEKE